MTDPVGGAPDAAVEARERLRNEARVARVLVDLWPDSHDVADIPSVGQIVSAVAPLLDAQAERIKALGAERDSAQAKARRRRDERNQAKAEALGWRDRYNDAKEIQWQAEAREAALRERLTALHHGPVRFKGLHDSAWASSCGCGHSWPCPTRAILASPTADHDGEGT